MWTSTAAAAAADDANVLAVANLAPCERGPQAQAANELDRRLAEAAGEGPTAVLQVVEQSGEQFTELNVITALWALANGGSGSGSMSGEEVVRSRPFQTLVGKRGCTCCGACPALCRLALPCCPPPTCNKSYLRLQTWC